MYDAPVFPLRGRYQPSKIHSGYVRDTLTNYVFSVAQWRDYSRKHRLHVARRVTADTATHAELQASMSRTRFTQLRDRYRHVEAMRSGRKRPRTIKQTLHDPAFWRAVRDIQRRDSVSGRSRYARSLVTFGFRDPGVTTPVGESPEFSIMNEFLKSEYGL